MLSKPQFEIIDGVLYHLEADKTMRIVPPTDDRKALFKSVHSGDVRRCTVSWQSIIGGQVCGVIL